VASCLRCCVDSEQHSSCAVIDALHDADTAHAVTQTHAKMYNVDTAHMQGYVSVDSAHVRTHARIMILDTPHVVARARVAHWLMLCRALAAWVVWEK